MKINLDDNLLFICNLIEDTERRYHVSKRYLAEKIPYEEFKRLYELAGIYHSQPLEQTELDLANKYKLTLGRYFVLKDIYGRIPTKVEMARVYTEIIIKLSICRKEKDLIKILIDVLQSDISDIIDNYNADLFFRDTDYLISCIHFNTIINTYDMKQGDRNKLHDFLMPIHDYKF